jgi:hypothetical protein
MTSTPLLNARFASINNYKTLSNNRPPPYPWKEATESITTKYTVGLFINSPNLLLQVCSSGKYDQNDYVVVNKATSEQCPVS